MIYQVSPPRRRRSDRDYVRQTGAGILIGFRSEDEWFEYRLRHDPRFLRRIEAARANMRAKRGTRLEDLPE